MALAPVTVVMKMTRLGRCGGVAWASAWRVSVTMAGERPVTAMRVVGMGACGGEVGSVFIGIEPAVFVRGGPLVVVVGEFLNELGLIAFEIVVVVGFTHALKVGR